MRYVEKSQSITSSLPVLPIQTIVAGRLVDVAVLEFQIYSNGVQTYPVTAGLWEAVDVQAHPAGARLGLGHYAATWAVPAAQPSGAHTIVWRWQETVTSAQVTYTDKFEVVDAGTINDYVGPAYASVSKMRGQGALSASVSDEQLLDAIVLSSRQIEKWTRRRFAPWASQISVRGNGSHRLQLGSPIIAMGTLEVDSYMGLVPFYAFDDTNYEVFNRHISQGLVNPDDRDNPKIELVSGRFPRAPQSIIVNAVFGYTDPDGTDRGRTPHLIERATMLLTMRHLPAASDVEATQEASVRARIIEERTRDQQYRLTDARGVAGSSHHTAIGYFTGDPAIDTIISMYTGPISIGAV